VIGAVLLGGILGEVLDVEGRLSRLGDLDRQRPDHRDLAEAARPQGRQGRQFRPALASAPLLAGLVGLVS
jgi:uncharacterized membrane protein YqgA involved in biofilm formation